ncbi:MAG: dockerin type I repeat-containing protein [Ruminococcus sp.]|nr:dockerin type I repeat-containing protein [Ruminococcus sp.]
MSYFIFNYIDSRDLGLILPKTPFRPSWAEQVEEITIPGRPEVIKNPNGIYANQSMIINAVISDSSKIHQIYSTLAGEGRLILSTATGEYINCRVEPLIPQGVALDMAELPITFDCYPFAYAIEPTVTEIGTSYTEVDNTSSIYSAPVIAIEMNKTAAPILKGDVNFDGKITPVDASLVLAEIANIAAGTPTFTPEQFAAADMDDSGTLTAADASAILALCADNQNHDPTTPAQNVIIYTNGAQLVVGIPDEVLANGFTVYVDCGLYLIYYLDTNGNMVNIMNYSSLDLPLLHTGKNYMMYSGDNVKGVTVTINERWL